MTEANAEKSDIGILTQRELEIVERMVKGWNNTQIGNDLLISPHTVKHHIATILKKLHVSNRTVASYIIGKYKKM